MGLNVNRLSFINPLVTFTRFKQHARQLVAVQLKFHTAAVPLVNGSRRVGVWDKRNEVEHGMPQLRSFLECIDDVGWMDGWTDLWPAFLFQIIHNKHNVIHVADRYAQAVSEELQQ